MASPTLTAAKFCRHCGYNLHGLPENRCPECGKTFDPNNPESYAKYSSSPSLRWWAKRIVVVLATLIILAGAGGLSLWYPWYRDQAIRRMVDKGYDVTTIVGPQWLQRLLGKRGGFLLERVQSVHLNGEFYLTDADLGALGGLSQLQCLHLNRSWVTDSGLERLKNAKRLEDIHLSGTQVTDLGLEHLKNMTGLRLLDFSRTRVTDSGLKYLKDLKRLDALDLQSTQVTDAGLEHLKDLDGLRYLNLWNTQVTDAGMGHLSNLKGLQDLYLYDTHVTAAGTAILEKALPHCSIHTNY